MEPARAADIAHVSHILLTFLCWTFTYWTWRALIPAWEGSWFEKLKWHWVAEEGWKYCCLLSFSTLQVALRVLSVALLPWWAEAIYLSCSLFYSTLTLLNCLQASQQCQCESGQTKNEDQTTEKLYQNKYLGQMAIWELRNLVSCF